MVAGPNGSGKSTILDLLEDRLGARHLGVRINPDDLERHLNERGALDLAALHVDATADEIIAFFAASPLLPESGIGDPRAAIRLDGSALRFEGVEPNAYLASILAAFLRRKLLESRDSFTFETVMSHPSKVAFLEDAHRAGFRTYLYYVAIDDPDVSVSRVANRVAKGGHDVPEDKIVERYHRSLALLLDALRHTDRAYLFDNSGTAAALVAEVTGAETLEIKTETVPRWFARAVWSKLPYPDLPNR